MKQWALFHGAAGPSKMNQDTRTVLRVSVVTMASNALLAVFKLLAGILASSGAMISDAVHTISDVFGTLAVVIGYHFSGKSPDKEHPYGHERIECLVALLLAAMLLVLGLGIGFQGLQHIVLHFTSVDGLGSPMGKDGDSRYNTFALAMALISVAAKEWMYRYTMKAANQIGSTSLKADAWHHRSDALSSVGGFVGILGLRLGYPLVDAAASLIICFFICGASFHIVRSAVDQLIDHALSDGENQKIQELILQDSSVRSLDILRTRMFGCRSYVDVEIAMDSELTLMQAHDFARRIHDRIERECPGVKHCMIHVNPYPSDESERETM